MRKLLGLGVIVAAAFATLFALSNGEDAESSSSQARIVSVLGIASAQGRDVLLHISLAVPQDADVNERALEALRERGARPLQRSEYVLLGPKWSDPELPGDPHVSQHYSGSGQPVGGALTALQNAQATWTDVSTSAFAFSYAATTDRCPSLLDVCPGGQFFDEFRDVAWADLGRCSFFRCTLAVTWFGDADGDGYMDDADVAFNTRVSPWQTGCGGDYDVQTVAIHEFGHVAGLGHSTVQGAIMYASYGGVRCQLHDDDVDGISALYPDAGGSPTSTPTPTAIGTPEPTPTPTSTPEPTATSTPAGFTLSVVVYKVRGVHHADLSWSGASGTNVTVLRDGLTVTATENDGSFTDNTGQRGGGVTYTYQVCETGSSTCSNEAIASP